MSSRSGRATNVNTAIDTTYSHDYSSMRSSPTSSPKQHASTSPTLSDTELDTTTTIKPKSKAQRPSTAAATTTSDPTDDTPAYDPNNPSYDDLELEKQLIWNETHPEYQLELEKYKLELQDRMAQIQHLRTVRLHTVDVIHNAEQQTARQEYEEQCKTLREILLAHVNKKQEVLVEKNGTKPKEVLTRKRAAIKSSGSQGALGKDGQPLLNGARPAKKNALSRAKYTLTAEEINRDMDAIKKVISGK